MIHGNSVNCKRRKKIGLNSPNWSSATFLADVQMSKRKVIDPEILHSVKIRCFRHFLDSFETHWNNYISFEFKSNEHFYKKHDAEEGKVLKKFLAGTYGWIKGNTYQIAPLNGQKRNIVLQNLRQIHYKQAMPSVNWRFSVYRSQRNW